MQVMSTKGEARHQLIFRIVHYSCLHASKPSTNRGKCPAACVFCIQGIWPTAQGFHVKDSLHPKGSLGRGEVMSYKEGTSSQGHLLLVTDASQEASPETKGQGGPLPASADRVEGVRLQMPRCPKC